VVAAILPTTNPTSTAIYKSLVSLKAGNAVVLSPHPNAKNCTCETASILYNAALAAGAPEDIIQCINTPTLEATNALMRHEKTGVILSDRWGRIVKAGLFEWKTGLRRRTRQCARDGRAHGRHRRSGPYDCRR
jgi:acyl-CoA reductase-like NAD-dependent aldehyde dehydrogenase